MITRYERNEHASSLPGADRIEVFVTLHPGDERQACDAMVSLLETLQATGNVAAWSLSASSRTSQVGSAAFPEGDYEHAKAVSDALAEHSR